MKLYVVKFVHYAPKDRQNGIQEYIFAKNEKELFNYLTSTECNYTYWNGKVDVDEYYDDEHATAEEQMQEWIENTIKSKGDLWDDDKFTDLYYGATGWYWEEVELDYSNEIIISMLNLMTFYGLAKKLFAEPYTP